MRKSRFQPRRARRAAELRGAALGAAAREWRVFPLVPGGKRPAIDRWNDRATTDPDRIERCWTPGRDNHAQWSLGIACGPSQLLVVDLDVTKPGDDIPVEYQQTQIRHGADVLADLEGIHGDLPATYTVATPSGGRHLYFCAPDPDDGDKPLGNSTGRLGWLIDTRGTGGFIVAAGSRTRRGLYVAVDPAAPVAELPGWIREELTRREVEPTLNLPEDERRRRAYVEAAVHHELQKILRSAPHTHNTSLFAASASLGRLAAAGHLDASAIRGALIAAGEAVGQPPKQARATIDSGLRNAGIDLTHRSPATPAPEAETEPVRTEAARQEISTTLALSPQEQHPDEATDSQPNAAENIEAGRSNDRAEPTTRGRVPGAVPVAERPELADPNDVAHIWDPDGTCQIHPGCPTSAVQDAVSGQAVHEPASNRVGYAAEPRSETVQESGASRDPKASTPVARATSTGDPLERARRAMGQLAERAQPDHAQPKDVQPVADPRAHARDSLGHGTREATR